MKNKLYKIFAYVFSVVFLLILIESIFNNHSLTAVINPFILLISFVVLTTILIVLYKWWTKINLTTKKSIIIGSVIFGCIIALEIIITKQMVAYPGWDWNDVYKAAIEFVNGDFNSIDYTYFKEFSNNYGILYMEIIIFKILKLFNLMKYTLLASVIVNFIFINTSILFIYLTIKKLVNRKTAVFGLFICALVIPFYTYMPVLYTDTVSMLFPIVIIYLYVSYLKSNKKNKNLLFLLIGLFGFIGMKIKFTVIIILIGIVIDMILRNNFKKYIVPFIYLIIVLITSIFCFNYIENEKNIFNFDIRNNNEKIPYTHWIMMGLTKRESGVGERYFIGTYSPYSYELTRSYKTTEERKKANIEEIKKSLKEYGILDYTLFLNEKMLFVWSDPTCYAPLLIDILVNRNSDNLIQKFLYKDGEYTDYTYIFAFGIMTFMYIMLVVGSFKSIKSDDNFERVGFISLFGILLFFLIWEASSRYVVNYIPIMIVLVVCALNKIIKYDTNIFSTCYNKIKNK